MSLRNVSQICLYLMIDGEERAGRLAGRERKFKIVLVMQRGKLMQNAKRTREIVF